MNERIDPNRPGSLTAGPAARISDPVTGAPLSSPSSAGPTQSPLGMSPAPFGPTPSKGVLGYWPVLIVLLAGVVLALLVWMPAEKGAMAPDTATQPAANNETMTAPAGNTTTAPAGNTTMTPATPTPQTNGTAPQN